MTEVGVEWGLQGALNYAPQVDAVVVVDVLSFSTSVATALSRGARVWPHPGGPAAAALAERVGARLAGRRGSPGPSLSPSSLTTLILGDRLVLTSPNGGMISEAVAALGQCAVYCAGLVNAAAVGRHVVEAAHLQRVVLVPAGERWPDGGLRVAYEDLAGAGAVIARMLADDPALGLSPEAESALATAERMRPLADTPSGAQLIEAGFGEDVTLASAVDLLGVVPVIQDGCFVPAQPAQPASGG